MWRVSEARVRGLPLGRRNGHDVGMRGNVRLYDRFSLGHGVGVAVAVDGVGFDEIFLMRGGSVDALVDRGDRARRHTRATIDALLGMNVEHRRLRELGLVL